MKTIFRFCLLLAISLSFSISQQANAQIVKTFTPVKDTAVNSDNTSISITPITSDIVAFHFKAEKVSGTVAGTASLQGSNDGTNWSTIDTAFILTNVSHNQTVFEPTKLSWVYYRIYVTTSGTCKINGIRGYTLRRTAR